MDKVHTEIFTFSLATAAIAFVMRGRLFMAAFLLAVASTQNLSFALIAFVPFSYRLVVSDKAFDRSELILAIATAILVLIHLLIVLTVILLEYDALDLGDLCRYFASRQSSHILFVDAFFTSNCIGLLFQSLCYTLATSPNNPESCSCHALFHLSHTT